MNIDYGLKSLKTGYINWGPYVMKSQMEDSIVKKFNINSTPTLLINGKKFEKSITFKNLKKVIEKLL